MNDAKHTMIQTSIAYKVLVQNISIGRRWKNKENNCKLKFAMKIYYYYFNLICSNEHEHGYSVAVFSVFKCFESELPMKRAKAVRSMYAFRVPRSIFHLKFLIFNFFSHFSRSAKWNRALATVTFLGRDHYESKWSFLSTLHHPSYRKPHEKNEKKRKEIK